MKRVTAMTVLAIFGCITASAAAGDVPGPEEEKAKNAPASSTPIGPPEDEPPVQPPPAQARVSGPHKKPPCGNKPNKRATAWGLADEGVQLRLRDVPPSFRESEIPVFRADVRNRGSRDLHMWPIPVNGWEIQVDGHWYHLSMRNTLLPHVLAAGGKLANLELKFETRLQGQPLWVRTDDKETPLEWSPGKHAVRVAVLAYDPKSKEPYSVRAESNPFEIEIIRLSPYAKSPSNAAERQDPPAKGSDVSYALKKTRVPMPLSEALAKVNDVHAEMAHGECSGESCPVLAIEPGDPKTRSPLRYWVFGDGGESGCRWVAYPRSLPGVYIRMPSTTSVNGRYPESYLTENGDVVSVRQAENIHVPESPVLVARDSTSIVSELYDDSGNVLEFTLSAQ